MSFVSDHSLLGDRRDSFINPTKGSFWSVSSEFVRTWLGSDVNFNKLYGQGFLYVPLAKNVIWVSGVRLGVGLRYLLPFGPIRFDFAYVLDPEPDETRYRFVLTLGHAF